MVKNRAAAVMQIFGDAHLQIPSAGSGLGMSHPRKKFGQFIFRFAFYIISIDTPNLLPEIWDFEKRNENLKFFLKIWNRHFVVIIEFIYLFR